MNATRESWPQRLTATGSVRDEALSALHEILIAQLRRTFRGKSGVDEALLEDVTQEALIKTLDNLDQFQGRSRFTSWATTIAVRGAFTELRRRRWKDVSLEHVVDGVAIGADQVASTDSGPHDQIAQRTIVEEMYRVIESQLTDKQRTALLAELKGMPLEEIGRRMGSHRNAIYKLTHDARKRLKQGLEAAGYSAADLQVS